MNRLAAYLFGHDLRAIRYPFLASIESALALTRSTNNGRGLVWFSVCDCQDGTEEEIREHLAPEIAAGDLKIVYHPWGDHSTIQVKICNFLLDQIGEQAKYALKLDADEVIHQDSFRDFQEDLEKMLARQWPLGRPHYTHLLDEARETDFIYRSKAVLSLTTSEQRYHDDDACALGGGGVPEAQTALEVVHYGKYYPGRRREALAKEITFTKLYKDKGFPDPRVVAQLKQGYIDYDQVFESAKHLGQIRPWLGTHPSFVENWIEESRRLDAEFLVALSRGEIKSLETEKWW